MSGNAGISFDLALTQADPGNLFVTATAGVGTYRRALPHQAAVDELRACSGTQFDEELVEIFLRKLDIYRDDRLAEGKDIPR